MVVAGLVFALQAGSALAKNYKITVVAGHPPIFLWVTLCRDYFIPEIDKRIAPLGHKITWNQAYGGTIAKIGGALEAIEEGVADMGFVGTIFEGTLTFMTAAAAIKVHEVAPYICMVNFGSQFAGGLSINKDVFESFPLRL